VTEMRIAGSGSPGRGARMLTAVGAPAGRVSLRRTLWAYGLARLYLGRHGAPATMTWACRPRPGPPADADAACEWVLLLIRPGRLPGTCLVRSIVLARVLSVGHGSPVVRLGVRREKGRLQAHAWVELGERSYGAHPGFEPLGSNDRPLPDVHDPHP
jgi:hypothetical protein